MRRAYRIALLAHAYRLLARRPEFWTTDRSRRLDRALTDDAPGRLPLLDAVLVSQAGTLDLLCAYAVTLLRRPGARNAEVLDLLGMLDPDRTAAIYHALPDDRRAVAARDPVWGYHLQHTPHDEITAALNQLDWIDPDPTSDVSAAMLTAVARPAEAPASP